MEAVASAKFPEGIDSAKFVSFTHPHNELVYWVIQAGFVTFLGFAFLFISLLKRLFFIHKIQALGYLALIAPFFIQAMFSYSFSLSVIHLFLLLFFVFLGIREDKKLIIINFERSSMIIYGVLVLFALMLTYGGWHILKSTEEVVYFKARSAYEVFNINDSSSERAYFEHAMYNPLYKEAVAEEMNILLQNSFELNKPKDVIQFVFWANKMDLNKHSVKTLIGLVKAYIFLKQPDRAMEVYNVLENEFSETVEFKQFNQRLNTFKNK